MHTYTGVPASTGIVVGPVEQIDHGTTGLHRIVCDPFRERALYDVAVVLAKDELRRLSQRAKGPDADILLFQIALLEDESFTNEIGDYIAAGAGADLIINLIYNCLFHDSLNSIFTFNSNYNHACRSSYSGIVRSDHRVCYCLAQDVSDNNFLAGSACNLY